jgi:putative oxidoreductase
MAMAISPGRYSAQAYALLRIVFGLLFLCHGLSKLVGWPVPRPGLPPEILWAAGGLEGVGGALIAAGLFTRLAAFVCCGEMAVAYFRVHAPRAFIPTVNGGELAVLYCFAFLFVAAHGPGIWSADGSRGRR